MHCCVAVSLQLQPHRHVFHPVHVQYPQRERGDTEEGGKKETHAEGDRETHRVSKTYVRGSCVDMDCGVTVSLQLQPHRHIFRPVHVQHPQCVPRLQMTSHSLGALRRVPWDVHPVCFCVCVFVEGGGGGGMCRCVPGEHPCGRMGVRLGV